MLLPQFSLRTILALVPVVALVAWAIARATSGSAWGIGVTFAVASLLMAVIAYVLFFFLCTSLGRFIGNEDIVSRTSRGGVIRESDQGPPGLQLAGSQAVETQSSDSPHESSEEVG